MGKGLNRKKVFPLVRILRLGRMDVGVRPIGMRIGLLVKSGSP
jgi:hypothetical protein